MLTNCVKIVKKCVEKPAQKTWMKNVQKMNPFTLFQVLNEFCRFSLSFSQLVLTAKKWISYLLNGSFYTFSTDTTNTTINIGRF